VLTLWLQANVVVNKDGHALLIEYGPTDVNPDSILLALESHPTIYRWTAPEIITLRRRGSNASALDPKHVDMFAFAMLAVEVFTGEAPFGKETDTKIAVAIAREKRPEKPSTSDQVGLTDEMWGTIESCWDDDPGRRPPIRDVVRMWPGPTQSASRGGGSARCVPIISVIEV
jgi:hypothetical protein